MSTQHWRATIRASDRSARSRARWGTSASSFPATTAAAAARSAGGSTKLQSCSRCHGVHYSDATAQRAAWQAHKGQYFGDLNDTVLKMPDLALAEMFRKPEGLSKKECGFGMREHLRRLATCYIDDKKGKNIEKRFGDDLGNIGMMLHTVARSMAGQFNAQFFKLIAGTPGAAEFLLSYEFSSSFRRVYPPEVLRETVGVHGQYWGENDLEVVVVRGVRVALRAAQEEAELRREYGWLVYTLLVRAAARGPVGMSSFQDGAGPLELTPFSRQMAVRAIQVWADARARMDCGDNAMSPADGFALTVGNEGDDDLIIRCLRVGMLAGAIDNLAARIVENDDEDRDYNHARKKAFMLVKVINGRTTENDLGDSIPDFVRSDVLLAALEAAVLLASNSLSWDFAGLFKNASKDVLTLPTHWFAVRDSLDAATVRARWSAAAERARDPARLCSTHVASIEDLNFTFPYPNRRLPFDLCGEFCERIAAKSDENLPQYYKNSSHMGQVMTEWLLHIRRQYFNTELD